MKTRLQVETRFAQDASRYAAYLETSEGRLRADLAIANLQEFLPSPAGARRLRALDLGGGTGAAAIRLARLGMEVTLLDSALAMLELAERAIAQAGASAQITILHVRILAGGVRQLTSLPRPRKGKRLRSGAS